MRLLILLMVSFICSASNYPYVEYSFCEERPESMSSYAQALQQEMEAMKESDKQAEVYYADEMYLKYIGPEVFYNEVDYEY